MSKVISFTVSENEMQALEAASRREGVDLLKEAAKLFFLGIEADKILHDQTVESLAQLLHKTRINETDTSARSNGVWSQWCRRQRF